ncbi:hypothetical protein [Acetobacterium wieringae]|uniref:hypothetical protein n=1 Tax=Acetobacterium wieringae TaxID=52694 RepID=UPI0026EE7861|nr:hypothetical protein [Acetobacterium wieringae]
MTAIPGIILQIIVVPLLVFALEKSGVMIPYLMESEIILAIDLSDQMIAQARAKCPLPFVCFDNVDFYRLQTMALTWLLPIAHIRILRINQGFPKNWLIHW